MYNFISRQVCTPLARRGTGLLPEFCGRGLALGSLALLAACGKHDDPPPAPPLTNGVSWTADNTAYTSSSAEVTDDGFLMTISGFATTPNGRNTIRLGVPLAIGTYTAPKTSYPAYYYMAYLVYTGSNAVAYTASNAGGSGTGTGTVTVTTLSATEVAGTFSFTGELVSGAATKTVINGKFNVKR